MKRLFYTFAFLTVLSCTAFPEDPAENLDNQDVIEDLISAEKKSWAPATRGSDELAFAKDIPWEVGDRVLLLGSDQRYEDCTIREDHYENGVLVGGSVYTAHPVKKTFCTVSKAAGLKCTLVPDTPLEEGTYRAIYPVYEYLWYDMIHLSFLYEDWQELDFKHQDIVISDPVTYKENHKLSFVMKHVCALTDMDIYPPKTGKYSYLKLFAREPVFAGKAEYWFDNEYDVDDIADGWLNFTTLRGEGRSMEAGVVFPTSTGLLPVQYDGMPMCIHLVYEDGTHYVSETFDMPSLQFGEVNSLVVKNFSETDQPLQGLWGDYYRDPSPSPYPVN